jgi:hypothetical protein
MYMTKEELLKRVDKYTKAEDGSSAVYWYNVGYKDAVNYVLQNFCKPDVVSSNELLEQKLNRALLRKANAQDSIESRQCDLTIERIKAAILVINDL